MTEAIRLFVALHGLDDLDSVHNFRYLRARNGQTWSFTTIDGTDRPHLNVLVHRPYGPAEETSFDVRVVNMTGNHRARFETTVDALVDAVKVWDGNAQRQRARN